MKKYIVLILLIFSILLPYAALWDWQPATSKVDRLTFEKEFFRIIQLTDFHEWMAEESKDSSIIFEVKDTLKPALEGYIADVLDIYQPDLVVLTGDNIFPLSFLYDLTQNIGVKTYEYIGKIFEERKQYLTLTFGNHDSECVANKEDLLGAVSDYKYFIGGENCGIAHLSYAYSTKDSNNALDTRLGNYSIPIYNGEKIAYNIFLLDSGSYNYVPAAGIPYRYILNEQAEWYKEVSTLLAEDNGGKPIPSIMFTHIPLLEHQEAYLQSGESIGVWTNVSPSTTRSRIFEDMLAQGDVRAIFVGHNHSNSITCFYEYGGQKIMMGITPQAAADSYSDNESVMRCRVIDINKHGGLVTFIDTSSDAYPSMIEYGQALAY